MSGKLKLAKSLFMHQQLAPDQLAELSGLELATIQEELNKDGGWIDQFNRAPIISCEQYDLVSPIVISHSKAQALRVIQKGLDFVAERDKEDISLSDVKDATSVLSDLDKIDRLDKGKATSITGIELDRMDAKEVVAARRGLSDYIDADYREIEYEEN